MIGVGVWEVAFSLEGERGRAFHCSRLPHTSFRIAPPVSPSTLEHIRIDEYLDTMKCSPSGRLSLAALRILKGETAERFLAFEAGHRLSALSSTSSIADVTTAARGQTQADLAGAARCLMRLYVKAGNPDLVDDEWQAK